MQAGDVANPALLPPLPALDANQTEALLSGNVLGGLSNLTRESGAANLLSIKLPGPLLNPTDVSQLHLKNEVGTEKNDGDANGSKFDQGMHPQDRNLAPQGALSHVSGGQIASVAPANKCRGASIPCLSRSLPKGRQQQLLVPGRSAGSALTKQQENDLSGLPNDDLAGGMMSQV